MLFCDVLINLFIIFSIVLDVSFICTLWFPRVLAGLTKQAGTLLSSLCYHHSVIITLLSSLCYHHSVIITLLSSLCYHHSVIITLLSSLCYHHSVIILPSISVIYM